MHRFIFWQAIQNVSEQYGREAWVLFLTFCMDQLRQCDDARSIATLTHLLDLAYLYFYEGEWITTAARQIRNDDQ
jgi:hypothetical protein